jgi:hypothetical protein
MLSLDCGYLRGKSAINRYEARISHPLQEYLVSDEETIKIVDG